MLLAHWLTHDERLTPARLVGVVCGLAGVAVMIGPQALESLGVDVLAQLAVLGAAVAYAFAGVFGRRFKGTPPMLTAAGQLSASALVMLPLVVIVDRPGFALGWMPGITGWWICRYILVVCANRYPCGQKPLRWLVGRPHLRRRLSRAPAG